MKYNKNVYLIFYLAFGIINIIYFILFFKQIILVLNRAVDMTSREKLDEMNKEFDELKHVASEFENEYNEIDKEKLNKNEKKKLEDCLLTTSRIVETNKLFMKTSRTVFSDVHVENIVQSDNENYTQTCVHCTKSFRSTFQLDNHKL